MTNKIISAINHISANFIFNIPSFQTEISFNFVTSEPSLNTDIIN